MSIVPLASVHPEDIAKNTLALHEWHDNAVRISQGHDRTSTAMLKATAVGIAGYATFITPLTSPDLAISSSAAGVLMGIINVWIISIVHHRAGTHKTIALHPVVDFFGQKIPLVTGGVDHDNWVATHLHHHRYADTSKDPHSPKNSSLGKMAFGLPGNDYTKAVQKVVGPIKQSTTTAIGLPLAATVTLSYAIGLQNVIIFMVAQLLMVRGATFLTNGLGHSHDEIQPNSGNSFAKNVGEGHPLIQFIVGVLTAGEATSHRNHHDIPVSADISNNGRNGAQDMGGWVIQHVLVPLKLATVITNYGNDRKPTVKKGISQNNI